MTYTAHVDTFARDNLPPRDAWPEFIFELPELRYPERLNCATAVLLEGAIERGWGERTAIIAPGGRRWTYADCSTAPTASPACWSRISVSFPAIACCCARRTLRCTPRAGSPC